MRRRSLCALFAAREGVAALEFGLVAIPFLMLSLGVIEFGRLIWTREALQTTAMTGARCMGVRAPSCASGVPPAYDATRSSSYIQSVAAGWGITLVPASITLSANSASAACTGLSEVSISYTFQTAVPGLLTMLSGGSSLTGYACFPNQT
jgi:Flp pilus assembly protein TadG